MTDPINLDAIDQLLARLPEGKRYGPMWDVHGSLINAVPALIARIRELEAENFTLAAGVCEYRSGDDHGNPYCLRWRASIDGLERDCVACAALTGDLNNTMHERNAAEKKARLRLQALRQIAALDIDEIGMDLAMAQQIAREIIEETDHEADQ